MRGLLSSIALLGIAALSFPSAGVAQNRGRGFGGSFSGPTVLNPSGVTGGVHGTAVYPATGLRPGKYFFRSASRVPSPAPVFLMSAAGVTAEERLLIP